MSLNDELNALLIGNDNDDEMRNDAFVDTVMAGIKQRHRRRHAIVASTGSLATLVAVAAWVSLPPTVIFGVSVDIRSTMAVLVLAALIGLAWLRTETHSHTT